MRDIRNRALRSAAVVALLSLAVACSDSDDGAPGDTPATIEAALTFVVQRYAALTDGLDRFVAAAEGDGSGAGVDLSNSGAFISGTIAFDLDDDPNTNETDVPVMVLGSLPLDFTQGPRVSLTGPAGPLGPPLANGSIQVTRNGSDGSISMTSDSGGFTSVNPPFEMILFNVMLTVDGDRSSLTGTAGYETIEGESRDIRFGSMTFRSTGSGFAVDVAESDGAYAFTVQ